MPELKRPEMYVCKRKDLHLRLVFSVYDQKVGPENTLLVCIGSFKCLTCPHFMGYRCGLFNYASKNAGVDAAFDFCHLEDKNQRRYVSSVPKRLFIIIRSE